MVKASSSMNVNLWDQVCGAIGSSIINQFYRVPKCKVQLDILGYLEIFLF